MELRYYEDMVVGSASSYGHYEVTREEVIAFASKYDPQAFHLSDEAAGGHHGVATRHGSQHRLVGLHALLLRAEDQEPEDHHHDKDGGELDEQVCSPRRRGRPCRCGLCKSGGNEH